MRDKTEATYIRGENGRLLICDHGVSRRSLENGRLLICDHGLSRRSLRAR